MSDWPTAMIRSEGDIAREQRSKESLMSDLVERLRVWPAAYGEDAMSSTYVGKMAKEAADEIERLRDEVGGLSIALEQCRRINDDRESLREQLVKAKEQINRRLEDLAEANAIYGNDVRLDAPSKVDRNNREISWLKDLRSEFCLPDEEGKS